MLRSLCYQLLATGCQSNTPDTVACYGLALHLPIRRVLRPQQCGINVHLLSFGLKKPLGAAQEVFRLTCSLRFL